MASSFDTEQVSQADRTYLEVMALYSTIMDTPGSLRVVRAEMRQGEVKPTCLDFKIDVELKAKRALLNDPMGQAEWADVMREPEIYPSIPGFTRETLGREFEMNNLGVDGAYRMLYFRVKNHHQNFIKETPDGIFE